MAYEIFKDIAGFEGLYQVSNTGKVKSLNYKGNGKEHLMATSLKKRKWSGYLEVHLSKNGKSYYRKVHRLVAEAFIPNPDNLPEINHKDEDKTNNNVENLEWCTTQYNHDYGTRNQRCADTNRKYWHEDGTPYTKKEVAKIYYQRNKEKKLDLLKYFIIF